MSTITVSGHRVTVSNADKTLYPDDGVTKGDVVEYYRSVAETMVPRVHGRPLTLKRFPDGIDEEGWFQKRAAEHFPEWLRVENIPQRGDGAGSLDYAVCDDAATLVYLANQASLEFHIWTSTVDDLFHPDLLVLDLDPPPGVELATLRDATRRTRDLFDDIGLRPYLQATGGSGYHVIAPLDRSADFDTVRALAGDIGQYLAARHADRLTTAHRKDERGNRIFLDANRNGYAQTFIAPYSLRSRAGATAATPLDWSELGRTAPGDHTIHSLPKRLAHKPDPWQGMHRHAAAVRSVRQRLDERARLSVPEGE